LTRLTLYTRKGCHLCDEAKTVLDRVAERTGETWTEIDIGEDQALEDEYGYRIPVLLLDGKEHGYFRVDQARLLRDLGAG
jgi:glutaredoxin